MIGYIIVGGIVTAVVLPTIIEVGIQTGLTRGRAQRRGAAGEREVGRCLKKFKGAGFAQSKDVLLPRRDKTSQIDNLLISRYGVFVIESKNYSGVIKGRERTPKWVQFVPRSKQAPREFQNPLWQNEGHIRALRGVLDRYVPRVPYHNIVVFPDNCSVPNVPGVVRLGDLRSTLKSMMKGTPVLTTNDVKAIKKAIDENNILNRNMRSEHVSYAKKVAFNVKEREKREIIRQKTQENQSVFDAIQQEYSLGKRALDEQIGEAEQLGDTGSSVKTPRKDIER